MTETPDPAPRLRIVRGDPEPEEIAALVIALTAAARKAAPPAAPPRSRWNDPALLMRKPLVRGPGAWRRRSLPL